MAALSATLPPPPLSTGAWCARSKIVDISLSAMFTCACMAYPPKASIEAAGKELKANPPKQLAKTAKKFGSADAKRQRVAIMLSKARKGA